MKKLLNGMGGFWTASIRRQLVLGIALVHAVMMSIFVADLVTRQQDFLHAQSLEQTESLANTLAVNSVSWMLSNDVVGMQEIVSSLARYPGVRYAMLTRTTGRVVGHTDPGKVGLYLDDPLSRQLYMTHSETAMHRHEVGEMHMLRNDLHLIDLAVPVRANAKIIGWARVAIDQGGISAGLNRVTRNGILYTLAAIAIGTMFALAMGAGLSRSLRAMARVADAFRTGKRNIRVKVSRRDEIGRLAQGFNAMLDVVSDREAALAASEERFDLAMRGSNDGLWDWNLLTNKIYFSSRWKTMLGYAPDEIAGDMDAWRKLVHPKDLPRVMRVVDNYLAQKIPAFEVEYRLRHKDGHDVWVLARGMLLRDATGKPVRMVGTHTDISDRKRMESMLLLDASVMDSAQEGIVITDVELRIVRINRAFTALTGYTADDMLGKTPSMLASGMHDPAFYARMWDSIVQTGGWRGEIWNRRKSGEVYAEILSITAIRDSAGQVESYIGLFTDITELKETQRSLERLANFDPLTGMPNRSLLNDRLKQAIAGARRQGGSLAVCFLDLDGFKAVNDRYGHDVGDDLLIEVARRLEQAVRGSDTVARLGGDEFVLLLGEAGSKDELSIAVNRILKDIAAPYVIDGHNLHVSASIGVSLYPQHHADPDTLVRFADQAMYSAKQAGRNCFHLFDAEHDQQTQSRYQMVGRVQQALHDGEFRLYYQPKVDMRSGRVVGLEALLRWFHPDAGMIPPLEFLPVVEDSDLIIDIGEWVMDQALAQMETWEASGKRWPVSVNIAARHLQQHDFLERVKAILARHPTVAPSLLEFEVLESAVIEDIGHARKTLLDCRALGISVAIDDFGTGYSSLSYLKHIPADILKIDSSFIRDLLENEDDLMIARGIIGLGEIFHQKVVAEGVETAEQGVLLLRMGCMIGQGYGISRPLPADEVAEWVEHFRPDVSWELWASADWELDDYPLLVGQYDHLKWMSQLMYFLQTARNEDDGADIVTDHHACRFGVWYYGRGALRYAGLKEFSEIAPLHERIHAIGTELMQLRNAGLREEALRRSEELTGSSNRFVEKLAALQQSVARMAPRNSVRAQPELAITDARP